MENDRSHWNFPIKREVSFRGETFEYMSDGAVEEKYFVPCDSKVLHDQKCLVFHNGLILKNDEEYATEWITDESFLVVLSKEIAAVVRVGDVIHVKVM